MLYRLGVTALALVVLSPFAGAQYQLTFTTLGTETTRSGSSGSSLATITPEDVAVVIPLAPIFYSAETYADHLNWNTLAGDGDLDAFFYEIPLSGHIDALQICRTIASWHSPQDLYFSTKLPLPCAGGGVIEPGDVAAIKKDAVRETLIDDVQIRSALGIPNTVLSFDVDAIARGGSDGTIFLSFEEGMPILNGSDYLDDGAVAAIPGLFITNNVCDVNTVAANSGVVALPEWMMNFVVANANAADNSGNLVTSIGDLDGLEIDPNGGTFPSFSGGWIFPNLIFSADTLSGGGILSTHSFGSIAFINGMPMATSFGSGITDGSQVGLDPVGVGSLDGLALSTPTCRFILDSETPYLSGPGTLNFTAGGADPFQPVLFYATIFGVNSAGGYQPSLVKSNICFPNWYQWNFFLFAANADNLGIVNLSVLVGAVPTGHTVVLQGLTQKSSAWSLSAPITIQF